MKIKAKLASLAAVAIIVGTQYPIASNADQPVLQGGDYIVVFDNQANEQAEAAKLRGQGANVRFTYSSVFKGLAGTFNTAQINALQKNPNVKYIEKDALVTADDVQIPTPSWGLDRIDQSAGIPISDIYTSSYSYNVKGSGVTAYVIDTGIASKNSDFTGRILKGYSAIGGGTEDCNGHGTHVAGTIGGTNYGVAKGVNLVPVRVLGCNGSGTLSGIIAGIDWVVANKRLPAVANLSLGAPKSVTVNNAVAKLVTSGIVVAVAAGNSTADACGYSPASEPTALTVGATNKNDSIASYSNFGQCVDIFAPGSSIVSDSPKGSPATMSGTSMASPHVAGVAALYLSVTGNASKTPAQVSEAIVSGATSNIVTGLGATSSPNLLLFTNY